MGAPSSPSGWRWTGSGFINDPKPRPGGQHLPLLVGLLRPPGGIHDAVEGMLRPSRPFLILPLFALACTGQAKTSPPGAKRPTAATMNPGGAIDRELLETARKAREIDRIKLRVDEEGVLTKLAVYHGDATLVSPAMVQLVEREEPGARNTRYENEWYADLGRVEEIEFDTADGKHCEIAGRADGELLYRECQVDPAQLPETIREAMATQFPEAKVLEAEEKIRGSETSYTLELREGGREFYLLVDTSGTITGRFLRVPALLEIPLPLP